MANCELTGGPRGRIFCPICQRGVADINMQRECPGPRPSHSGGLRAPIISELPPQKVSVIVVCHNYGRFLSEAVESVIAQTQPPAEIVIVDDDSTDDSAAICESLRKTRGVQYLRVAEGHPLRAREAGFHATTSPVVCFLDADDRLSPKYLETGVPLLTGNVGIAHSDFEMFGARTGPVVFQYDADQFQRRNLIHAGSLVLRCAIESADAFNLNPPISSHEDWAFFRRVTAAGWDVAKNPTPYGYRRHGKSRTSLVTSNHLSNYFSQAALECETVTLFIPLCGRLDAWTRMSKFLQFQTWPRGQTRLILHDGSGDFDFGCMLRQWLDQCDYIDIRYIDRVVSRPGLADEDRRLPEVHREVQVAMSRIYSMLRELSGTEFIWTLEDDVIPPNDVCERLLSHMADDVASVSAPYRSRYHDGFVAWNHAGAILPGGTELEQIGGNGFGCNIIRRSVLRHAVIRHDGPRGDFDPNFYLWLKTFQGGRWRALIDWDCECAHIDSTEGTDQ